MAYLIGVFCGQLANTALNVTLPLLLLQISHSVGLIAFVSAVGQGLDAVGTLVGGRLGSRMSPRLLLILSTGVRAASLACLPLLLIAQAVTVPLAIGVYLVDSLARGATDTGRATIPLLLARSDREAIARLNAHYQACFEAGNLAGPFVVAALLATLGTVTANWLAPAAFAITTLIYFQIPRTRVSVMQNAAVATATGTMREAVRAILTDPVLRIFFVSVVLLTLYPVKALLPVLFAGQVLNSPQDAAWLAGFFGLGGVAGSLLYHRLRGAIRVSTWLQWSAIGVGVYSTIFISANFFTMAAGILLFSSTNVLARLATTSTLQAHLPEATASPIMGVSRFSINVLSMVVRLLVGLAFTLDLDPKQGFSTVGIILFVFAFAQFTMSHRVATKAYDASSRDDDRGGTAAPTLTLFDKNPNDEPRSLQRRYLRRHGLHFYFRTMLLPMQRRVAQLMDHSGMPRVFLHGSPHVQNYAKTERGAALLDFDRSRRGPYAWDIVRLLTSVALVGVRQESGFLSEAVLQTFQDGYLRGLRHPELGYEEMDSLRSIPLNDDQRSTTAYLLANKGWAKAMRADPVPAEHPDVRGPLRAYLEGRDELALLDTYAVVEAGRATGSLGCEHLLIVLAPRDAHVAGDRIFLDLKCARQDPDDEWYTSGFAHHGQRIVAAADLYAPGREQRQGFLTYQGRHYWGHEVPRQNVKLKGRLTLDRQCEFAYAAGTQLGRGHRLSLEGASAAELEQHFQGHFAEMVSASRTVAEEMRAAHARYVRALTGDQPATERPSKHSRASVGVHWMAWRSLAAPAAALLSLLLFAFLPLLYSRPDIAAAETAFALWLHSLWAGVIPPEVFSATLQLGAIEFVYVAALLIGLWLWRKKLDPVYHVSLLLLIAGSARLLSVELKRLFQRPHAAFWSDKVMLKNAFLNVHNKATQGFGYPSSQAIIVVCFSGFLLWLAWRYAAHRPLPRLAWAIVTAGLIALVAVSTLSAGIYYPTDVIGGCAFALFWLLLWLGCAPLFQRLQRSVVR